MIFARLSIRWLGLRFAALRFLFLNFEALQFAGHRAWKCIVTHRKRMNAVIRRDLFGQVLDFEANHFHDRGLAPALELVHLRHDNGMNDLALRLAVIFGNAEDADLLNERRFRIVRFEFFRIHIFPIREHDHVFAAPGDGKLSARTDEAEIAGS